MLTEGIRGEKTLTVREEITALAVGSGALPVFATPALAALMEGCAHDSLLPYMEAGQGTVGTELHLSHLAPTPVGGQVRCVSILTKIEGRLFTFELEAYDDAGLIATATHTRCLITEDRFMSKAQSRLHQKN